MKPSHTIRPIFDNPNLVSSAGLVPALRLAEAAGLYDLLDGLSVPSANAGAKTAAVIGGMLAGADSIDDLDLLRHGGLGRLFAEVRAPSTLGTFLRTFTHGHVQQLDKINAGLLAGLASRVPDLLAGSDVDGVAFLDLDDTMREVHGYAKQGAAFGYSKVRGLNIQLATISTPTAAPVIARARLRKGNTASATGCGRLLDQATSAPLEYRCGTDGIKIDWLNDAHHQHPCCYHAAPNSAGVPTQNGRRRLRAQHPEATIRRAEGRSKPRMSRLSASPPLIHRLALFRSI